MSTQRLFAIAILCLGVAAGDAEATTRYAGPSASGANTCNTWADRCLLQSAIDASGAGDEVWALTGTYTGATIHLKSGVHVIGGFASGASSAEESDPEGTPSIIDGEQSRRCVLSDGNDASTMLRGFTLTRGWDGSDFFANEGGGCVKLVDSSALIVDCVLQGNWAQSFGGAVKITGSGGPQFISCTFQGNGVNDSDPQNILRVLAGGAVYVDSGSPAFTNCLFYQNEAMEAGAMAVHSGTPTLVNCTVVDNTAFVGYGGGLYDPVAGTTVHNSIFWGNSAVRGANQLGAHPNHTIAVSDSDVEGGYTGTNMLDSDPLFVSGSNDYRLQATSPCKDTGDAAALPTDVGDLDWDGISAEPLPYDLDRLIRTVGTEVDMGAFEYRECASDSDCSGSVCCAGICESCCVDTDCDDGLFCNGAETCVAGSCTAGADPCLPGLTCIEETDACGCNVDADCDDGVFCNGVETCASGACQSGTDPCPGQLCDEVGGVCVNCLVDTDCAHSKLCCSGNCQECCNNQDCPGFGNVCCPDLGFVCSIACPWLE